MSTIIEKIEYPEGTKLADYQKDDFHIRHLNTVDIGNGPEELLDAPITTNPKLHTELLSKRKTAYREAKKLNQPDFVLAELEKEVALLEEEEVAINEYLANLE